MFIQSTSDNTDELIDVTTDYVNFCVDKSIPQKTVKVYSNSKPWINSGISKLLQEKKNAFFMKDKSQMKVAQKKLEKAIKREKEEYKQKLEASFEGNNMKKVWDNMKLMSGYMQKNQKKNVEPNPENSIDKANELNTFYTRFDVEDFSEEHEKIRSNFNETNSFVTLETSEDEVRNLLKACNPKKAPGPDKILPKVLKTCADQLAFIFKTIFNACFEKEYVPESWKMSCIIPVPKKPIVKVLNDLRPVALTSAIMKICEKIVLNRLTLYTRRYLDPLQFAYQSRRNTEDAILFMLNNVYKHLDKPGNSVRIMFYDFSSAFNTIQPHLLVEKMKLMNIPQNFIKWIFSYLTNRPQFVRLAVQKVKGNKLKNDIQNNYVNSDIVKTNTGAPQGTVLSPFLFTIYTADGKIPACPLVKFADDTSQVGLIEKDNDLLYKSGIQDFVNWCKNNFLKLNVAKTKEIIFDFRRANHTIPEDVIIDGDKVERVDSYKYLGVIFDNKLSFSKNVTEIIKKINSRMYCLYKLRAFNVKNEILQTFYTSTIRSVFSYGLVCFGGNLPVREKKMIDKIIKKAESTIGKKQQKFDSIYEELVTKRTKKILYDNTHPLNEELQSQMNESGRLRQFHIKNKRYQNSFLPVAVTFFNSQHSRDCE